MYESRVETANTKPKKVEDASKSIRRLMTSLEVAAGIILS